MMTLDHILLGLLREPQSGYELKAAFDLSLNYFWPAELSQIYRNLKRLEADGAVTSRSAPSEKGPERRVYSLTPAGRRKRTYRWNSARSIPPSPLASVSANATCGS